MGNPTVSIVLPTYNGSRYLGEAVESCLDQTFHDWELVIVDDACDDDTPEIIARYEGQDPRVQSVRHETNRKLPASLNTGFNLARGDLLTWTSDDNRYRPEALTAMVGFLETHPDVDIVYTDSTIIDEEGNPIQYRRAREPDELSYCNCVGACFLLRQRVHERVGGYDDRRFLVEDYDFWLRASQSFRLCALHEDHYLYRARRGSLSDIQRDRISLATIELLQRHLKDRNWEGPDRSLAFLRMAREASSLRRRVSALSYLVKAVAASPGCLFQRNAIVPFVQSLFGPELVRRLKKLNAGGLGPHR